MQDIHFPCWVNVMATVPVPRSIIRTIFGSKGRFAVVLNKLKPHQRITLPLGARPLREMTGAKQEELFKTWEACKAPQGPYSFRKMPCSCCQPPAAGARPATGQAAGLLACGQHWLTGSLSPTGMRRPRGRLRLPRRQGRMCAAASHRLCDVLSAYLLYKKIINMDLKKNIECIKE